MAGCVLLPSRLGAVQGLRRERRPAVRAEVRRPPLSGLWWRIYSSGEHAARESSRGVPGPIPRRPPTCTGLCRVEVHRRPRQVPAEGWTLRRASAHFAVMWVVNLAAIPALFLWVGLLVASVAWVSEDTSYVWQPPQGWHWAGAVGGLVAVVLIGLGLYRDGGLGRYLMPVLGSALLFVTASPLVHWILQRRWLSDASWWFPQPPLTLTWDLTSGLAWPSDLWPGDWPPGLSWPLAWSASLEFHLVLLSVPVIAVAWVVATVVARTKFVDTGPASRLILGATKWWVRLVALVTLSVTTGTLYSRISTDEPDQGTVARVIGILLAAGTVSWMTSRVSLRRANREPHRLDVRNENATPARLRVSCRCFPPTRS